jgi:hypothetical protein
MEADLFGLKRFKLTLMMVILVLTTKMRVVSNCPSGGHFFSLGVKNEDEGRF